MTAHPLRKELIDQSAHFAAAFAVVALASVLGSFFTLWAGALVGLALGLSREVAQHNTFRIWTLGKGSRLDLCFWALGGLAGTVVT